MAEVTTPLVAGLELAPAVSFVVTNLQQESLASGETNFAVHGSDLIFRVAVSVGAGLTVTARLYSHDKKVDCSLRSSTFAIQANQTTSLTADMMCVSLTPGQPIDLDDPSKPPP